LKNTAIGYVHHTFNPWWGCVETSAGCLHCFAKAWARRCGKDRLWGPDAERMEMRGPYWRDPLRWDDAARAAGVRERVLCGSMCDVFEWPHQERVLSVWRRRLWETIEATPNLDWLLITKRPENFERLLPQPWQRTPRPNVWLIATVESAEYAGRIDALLRIPAVVHGLSIEPMLGPMAAELFARWVDWVILGGENCAGARPFDLEAGLAVLRLCREIGIPAYAKQLGSDWAKRNGGRTWAGDDPADWPEEFRVREFPEVRAK